ncbi:DUF4294 domain-containing protein [Tenacibaculum sp. SG-28]|uniref:DUF4294 domain-containing protein n=1 Tax=Tenacibaculum sp. SG-28 TaxID=754426 RepID=UPI000CF41225|nr:DUF4294 domain-containing protein [Tenacibaculum sp. SG-28]PQJ23421.1 hypothetical protein BSU00_04345 [Tenacibaculum sp. SG-28]
MKNIAFFLCLLYSVIGLSQIKDTMPTLEDEYFLVKDNDSLMIALNEVVLLPKHKFASRVDARYYFWFKKKVFKAYPYALLASKRLDSLNVRLDKISSKSKKRKYVKKVQKYLEEELTGQLKKLTRTEGRLLLKLIHRQTGKTAFQNIKELRSGWKAFWYNSSANVFKLSLKSEYDPANVNEDYLTEDVLQRAFMDETLEYQKSKLQFDHLAILYNRKGEVNVEEYKSMFAKQRKKQARKKRRKQKNGK